jgi:HlyD family secretion protein
MRLRLRATTPLIVVLIAAACGKSEPPHRTFDAVRAERRDLAASAIADGTVEPILTVEVKSKASGEIIEIPVDTGDDIRPGQVLVRIDPLDNQNAFDQADANLRAAIARQETTRAALARSTNLHGTGLLTDSDFDQVRLQTSEAEADAVKARIALDTAKRRLDETTVRSPMAGTILTRGVEVGNVIASAVSQVSGGTVLMTMADLSTIQVRSLVDEADIGRIAAGMAARVTVEAHPGRVYEGTVQKIEPQAVTEQNVTLFPVLVHLANPDGSLRPGMNAEVEMLIDRRHDVLTVPAEALRSPKEAAAAARFLGLELQAPNGTVQAAETGAGPDRASDAAPGMPSGPKGRRGERGGRKGAPPAGEAKAPVGRPAVVFVEGASGPEMRSVVAGLSDWEYTEVLSGLADGEKVLLLPSATVMRQEQEAQERFRRGRTMPGMDGSGKAKQGSGR